ncbi:hypothetical protein M404DRAFT_895555 [Pisolithus tinctorius Marx 270]|uniref:NACHT domain-containing protein n=1 Tax=Pisolithus tinctorius Marx 270 TaxID=870435 RepID=A0A0C3IKH8_PISTI|nr:hypothetical protein M404DRAFT_895555 [Pisolithus tinctorius Marx 270]
MIRGVYEFLAEEDTINNIDSMKDTLAKIAGVICNAVQFIKDYSKTKSFWKRTEKNIGSKTQAFIDGYTMTLNDLMQQYRDRTARDTQINVYHILEDLNLEGMAYAAGAGLDTSKICLDGTRTEILRRIIDWITDPRPNAPRIMWLQGQAGRGKSVIAHTIAAWIKDTGGLGSCFCFARDRLSEHREEKILTTIARDLADRDPSFRRALADVVSKDYSLKTTRDVSQQWQRLLLKPLSRVNGVIVGNVVMVIDALDESGPETSRSRILPLLASQEAAHLPPNFRILLTSRLLPDIEEAFTGCQHLTVTCLDEVPLETAEHDIHLFVSNELRHPHLEDVIGPKEIDQITQKSGGLFEWARVACEFIKRKRAGQTLRERFEDVMALRSGEGGTLLDKTYTTILQTAIPPASLARFRSVMGQILTTLIPLPMSALQLMRKYFPNEEDHYDIAVILEFMAPVLAGVNDSSPVRPLHASFYDFLTSQSRSRDYFISTSEQYDLSWASLRILCNDLQFNICRLESSYFSNSEVLGLQERINKYITPQLSYSCQFWAQHLQKTTFDPVLAELVRSIVGSERILFWLEILSVIGEFRRAVDTLIYTASWLLDQPSFEDALGMVQDEIKFIMNFGGAISHSAPHLYISALPFIPSDTRLAKVLMPMFSGLVGVTSGGLREWMAAQLSLEGHAAAVYSVAFSPDGKRIVSGSCDKTVRVWDAERGVQVGSPLQGHTDWVLSVTFSCGGKKIVSGSKDKTVRVWDAERGVQISSPLQGHVGWVGSVAVSPDGMKIVSGSDDETVRIWDAERGVQIGSPLQGHTDWVKSVAFSPDGKRIVSGSKDKTVRVWDTERGMQIGSPLHGHTGLVHSVTFSSDGKRIVSGSEDKTTRFWDTEEGVQLFCLPQGHSGPVSTVAFSPDGQRIVLGSKDNTVRIWDSKSGVEIGCPLLGHTHGVLSVAFSPDGERIVSGSADKTVRVWDVERSLQIGSSVHRHVGWVESVAFSPDGRRIVSGSSDKTVRIWDAERGMQIGCPLEGHTNWIKSVAFSPDGKMIISGSDDKTVRVWDAEKSAQIGSPLQGHTGWVHSVVFSPDGKRIVSGSSDKTMRVWDTESHEQLYCLPQSHTGPLSTVAFSLDGTRIASGSYDSTIRTWNTQKYEDIITHHQNSKTPACNANAFGTPQICFSSVLSHALHDSEQLLDGFQPQHVEELIEPVKLHPDGWMRGPEGRLLLWLPPTFWRPFYSSCNVAVIPKDCCTELDMSHMVHGDKWHRCLKTVG